MSGIAMTAEDREAVRVLLERRGDDLTEWEDAFLRGIRRRAYITPKERGKLDEIFSQVMAGDREDRRWPLDD